MSKTRAWHSALSYFYHFFFQAEDGIRDLTVTGVQTCALPISKPSAQVPAELTTKFVEEAKLLEDAGASLLDFTNSGPEVGAAVAAAVSIPVIGGFGDRKSVV